MWLINEKCQIKQQLGFETAGNVSGFLRTFTCFFSPWPSIALGPVLKQFVQRNEGKCYINVLILNKIYISNIHPSYLKLIIRNDVKENVLIVKNNNMIIVRCFPIVFCYCLSPFLNFFEEFFKNTKKPN